MPDTRWQKVRRDATQHLPRTLLVALAIAVALGGAGIVLVSWALVRRATNEGYLASDPPIATLRTERIDAIVLATVRALPGVRDAQARRTMTMAMQIGGVWQSAVVFAAANPAEVRLGTLSGVEGAWPPPPGTIAIERSSVDFSGTGVGDSVIINTGDSLTRRVPVVGIVRDVGLAPGWMEHVVYVWTSLETLEALGFPAAPDELQLGATNRNPTRKEMQALAAEVRRAIEQTGRRVYAVDVPEPGEHIHAAQMDSMLVTQGAFGSLALLVAVFLVVNLMAATLTGQTRQIAIMKTLGATDRDLAVLYLVFAGLIGVLASLLALPVAIIGGRRYAAMRGDMLNFDIAAYNIPWWSIALLVAAGLLLPLAAAWFPVRRGVRTTVAAALRDLGITDDAMAGEPTLARRGGWSRVLVLSLRNAFRRKQRMRLTMLTLASGGAVFVAAGNVRRAVIGSMDLIYGSQRYAFSVRLADAGDAALIEKTVRGVAGVSNAEAWAGVRAARIEDGLPGDPFPLVGIAPTAALLDLTLVDGPCPDRTAALCGLVTDSVPSLLVSRSMLRLSPEVARGSRLLLEIAGQRREWTVAGIFEGGPTPSAYTSTAALDAARGDTHRASVMVATQLTGLASQVDLIARVRSALSAAGMPVASTQLLAESRRVTEDHLLMVVQFLSLMGWVMILVGGMGLASTMGLAVMERTREIGVMRAIGATHGTLFSLVQLEGLVIALLGWACAIPLSLPFSLILGEAFSRIMFRVPVHWTPHIPSMLIWFGIVVAISLVACALPALRAMRQPIARTLAYEQ